MRRSDPGHLTTLLRGMRKASGIDPLPLSEEERRAIPGLSPSVREPPPPPPPAVPVSSRPESRGMELLIKPENRFPVVNGSRTTYQKPPPAASKKTPPPASGPEGSVLGPSQVVALLKRLKPDTARRLVGALHERDPKLAIQVGMATHPGRKSAGRMRSDRERFSRLARNHGLDSDALERTLLEMDEPVLQKVLRGVTHGTLVIVTKEAGPALKRRIFDNISERKYRWLADDIRAISNISPGEAHTAREEMQNKVHWAKRGRP